MQSISFGEGTSLGVLDYEAVSSDLQESSKKKRKNNKFSDGEQYLIEKYTSVDGTQFRSFTKHKNSPHSVHFTKVFTSNPL